MAKMTLEGAIKHEKEVAKRKYNEGFLCHANPDDGELDQCIECAKEHEQLAEWLEELKAYKDAEEKGMLVRSPYKTGGYVYCVEKYLRGYEVCAYKYLAKAKGHIVVYIPDVSIDENVDESLAEMCKDSQEWYKLDAMLFEEQYVFATRREAEKKVEELENNGQNT